jgi:hypothetical protein
MDRIQEVETQIRFVEVELVKVRQEQSQLEENPQVLAQYGSVKEYS